MEHPSTVNRLCMATLRKTSAGNWNAWVRKKGFPEVSKTFLKKANAQAWANETEELMRTGKFRVEGEGTLLSEIISRYKGQLVTLKRTSAFHDSNLGILDREIGHIDVYDLSPNDIVKFVSKRRETVSSSTIRKEVNTLNHVVETAMSLYGINILANPVHKAKTALKYTDSLADSKPRARRLADGEEDKLMAALSGATEPKLAAILTLETGRRLRELLDIRPELISVVKDAPGCAYSTARRARRSQSPCRIR